MKKINTGRVNRDQSTPGQLNEKTWGDQYKRAWTKEDWERAEKRIVQLCVEPFEVLLARLPEESRTIWQHASKRNLAWKLVLS